MTERKVRIDDHVNEVETGRWVDNLVINDVPYAVVVTDDGKILGVSFNILTVIP